jgi:hypothetical protein
MGAHAQPSSCVIKLTQARESEQKNAHCQERSGSRTGKCTGSVMQAPRTTTTQEDKPHSAIGPVWLGGIVSRPWQVPQCQCGHGAPRWQEWPRVCDAPPETPDARRPNLWAASQQPSASSRGHTEKTGHYWRVLQRDSSQCCVSL